MGQNNFTSIFYNEIKIFLQRVYNLSLKLKLFWIITSQPIFTKREGIGDAYTWYFETILISGEQFDVLTGVVKKTTVLSPLVCCQLIHST